MSGRGVLAANNLFALVAKLLEGGKSVLVALLVIQFFSPAEFGVYSVAIAVGSVVAVIAEFRLMGILLRLFSQFPKLTSRLVVHAISINVFFALLGIGLTALSFWFVDDVLYQCLMLYSLSYLFKFGRCIRGVLVAGRQNQWVAVVEVVSGIIVIGAIGVALLFEVSIQTVVLIRAVDFLLVSLLYVVVVWWLGLEGQARSGLFPRSGLLPRSRLTGRTTGFLLKKSFPLVLSGAAMLLFQRVDLIFIQTFMSSSDAGIYAAATAVVSVFGIFALVLSENLAPKLFVSSGSSVDSSLSTTSIRPEVWFGQTIVLIGLVMSGLCFAVSPLVIGWLFDPEYFPATHVAKILSLTPFAISLGAFAGQVIIKERLEQGVFVKSILACIVTILLNLWWVPLLGIEGAAWATVLGLFIANYLSHFFITRLKSIFVLQNLVVVELFGQLVPRFTKAESR